MTDRNCRFQKCPPIKMTLLERDGNFQSTRTHMASIDESAWEARARQSLADGEQAFERLLSVAEKKADTGQAGVIVSFIASVLGLSKFDLYDLRRLDVDSADDVMACIDTIRWRKAHLADLVLDGWTRARTISADWGFAPAA